MEVVKDYGGSSLHGSVLAMQGVLCQCYYFVSKSGNPYGGKERDCIQVKDGV